MNKVKYLLKLSLLFSVMIFSGISAMISGEGATEEEVVVLLADQSVTQKAADTALHLAVRNGDTEAVEELLAGEIVSSLGVSWALVAAAQGGRENLVQRLLDDERATLSGARSALWWGRKNKSICKRLEEWLKEREEPRKSCILL